MEDSALAQYHGGKLRGNEFRLGIARGRALGGDWGVSFVKRSFEDADVSVVQGSGYQASGSGGVFTVLAHDLRSDMRRRDVELTGIEAHKFIAFATIARRVQIGLNLAGGFGTAKGSIETTTFDTTTTCRIPGNLPATESPCALPNATILSQTTAQTGSFVDDASRLFKQERMPIGRVELAAGIVLGSQFKVRVGGGLNYPGTNNLTVTGIYLFSRN
jgi:hypothetical protein